MISIEMSVRHMMWADAKLFDSLGAMPAEWLTLHYGNPDWTVGRMAMHLVQGAEWYRYILTGAQWTDVAVPTTPADAVQLGGYLQVLYGTLLEQCARADELIEFEDEDGTRAVPRAMVLSQAVYHATEHRTQIACALEVNGHRAIDLDTFDLWQYLAEQREAPQS